MRATQYIKSQTMEPCVDIFAPGASITGAEHSCAACIVDGVSGTSLAAPLVCGIAAVHLSRYPLTGPAELKQKIIDISSTGLINFNTIPSDFQATTPNKLASYGKFYAIVLLP